MNENKVHSICFVLPSLTYGGAELQTINHVNALKGRGYKITLIVLSEIVDTSLLSKFLIDSKDILILKQPDNTPSVKLILRSFFFAIQIDSFLKTKAVQVVIANLPLSHFLLRVTKLITPFIRVEFKLINYHHSLQYEANPLDTTGKRVFYKLNLLLSKHCDDDNIFISNACYEDISKYIPVINPIIIHNSVPFKEGKRELAIRYLQSNNISMNRFLVVVPGRMHPSKGHSFFIDALSTFLNEDSISEKDIFIIFAGGLILEDKIRREVQEKRLNNLVHITGAITNDLLLSLLKVCDLTVIPSIHEGFGNIAVEALMQESLILASDAGGLPEIIKDGYNGFIFEKENQDSLIDKLTSIYLGKLSVDKQILLPDFHNRFSFEVHISKLLSVING